MKRKKLPPGTRQRWDDPNLTCWGILEITAEQMQKRSIKNLQYRVLWKNDPSYNWAEQVKKKRNG